MRRAAAFLVLAAGCAPTPEAPPATSPAETIVLPPPAPPQADSPAAAPPPKMPPASAASSIDDYRRQVATRIAQVNASLISESLPPMLKSIVVLDVTLDRDGNVSQVSVRRSNGFRDLERRAMDSVRRGAPYPTPGASVHRGARSVNFLETFLFRDDGRYRIRSLEL